MESALKNGVENTGLSSLKERSDKPLAQPLEYDGKADIIKTMLQALDTFRLMNVMINTSTSQKKLMEFG